MAWLLLVLSLLITDDPKAVFQGHWKADPPENWQSRADILNAGVSFDVTRDSVTISGWMFQREKREIREVRSQVRETFLTDGRPHLYERNRSVTAQWVNAHLLQLDSILGDGYHYRTTYEVAADGKTMQWRSVQGQGPSSEYQSEQALHR